MVLLTAVLCTLLIGTIPAGAAPPPGEIWARYDRLIAEAQQNLIARPAAALNSARAATALAAQKIASGRYLEAAATAWCLQSAALTRLHRIQEARIALNRASALAARKGTVTTLDGIIELNRGRIADNSGDVALALRSFQKAHAMFARLGDKRKEALALEALGTIYYEAHDFGRQISYYRRASQLYSSDPLLLLSSENNIGLALQQIGRYDQAQASFLRALKIAASLKSPTIEGRVLTNLAFVYAKQHKLVLARQAADRALDLFSRSDENGWARFAWGAKAEIEYQRGAIAVAAAQLDRAFRGVDLRRTTSPFRDLHEIAYRIYREAGDYRLALAHLEAFKRLDDQGQRLAASTNLALVGAQFDFATQRLEIEQLRSEQLRRNISLRESRDTLQRLLLLTGILAALLVIAWIGWRHGLVSKHRNAIGEKNSELLKTLAQRDAEIARRSEIEAQLRLASETAQQANRAKSHFLANMSHELRTPLNAIIGFSELMTSAKATPEKAREYAANIAQGGRHLLSIVNDILDMARIEAGKLTLAEAPVDIDELVRNTISVIGGGEGGGRKVIFDSTATGVIVRGDEVRLRQIIINLLSNALKFAGAQGQVSVLLRRAPDGPDLIVRDNGPGIPADKLEMILEPFGQAESTYARPHGGAGLGLPIVKSLTELHGGLFTIQSEFGKGTEARVHLPAERVMDSQHKKTLALAS